MKKGVCSFLIIAAIAIIALSGCVSSASSAANTASDSSAVSLWNFESQTTDGWHGNAKWAESCSVNTDPQFVKEGKYSLRVELKGSKGWNQDVAVFDGPFPENFAKFKTVTIDMFVPGSTVAGLEYAQVFLVISGSVNGWYQQYLGMKSNWNRLVFKMDPAQLEGDLFHAFIVFNTSAPFNGPVYIDNIRGNL
jgi:hypothetical protein